MEPRKRARAKARPRGLKRTRTPPKTPRTASTPWPILEQFLEHTDGSLTLGSIGTRSLGCTAVASDEHDMLVALVRKSGETMHQLLDRLEHALGPAIDEQIFVDEINGPE